MKSPIARYQHHQYTSQAQTQNDLDSTCVIYQLLLDDLDAFTGATRRNETALASEKLAHGLKALSELKAHVSLDLSDRATKQLSEFYDYCTLTLAVYSLDRDIQHIQEVKNMIQTVKEAWDELRLSQ